MTLVVGCAPRETPQEDTQMENQSPLDNGTPDSGNPLDEGPVDEGPTNDNQGSRGLKGLEFAEDNPKEAFKLHEDMLIETNNGYFEAV